MKPLLLPILMVIAFAMIAVYFLAVYYVFLQILQQKQVVYTTQRLHNTPQIVLISNNTILPQSAVYYPKPKVYASLSGRYDKLIDCLIRYESSRNREAVGDDGKAFGWLQFHKPTFNHFSKKYKIELDYYNSDDQVILAELMLQDDIENVKHWSVWRNCYK